MWRARNPGGADNERGGSRQRIAIVVVEVSSGEGGEGAEGEPCDPGAGDRAEEEPPEMASAAGTTSGWCWSGEESGEPSDG